MTNLEIRELATDKELDREAMTEINGGSLEHMFTGVDVLSPDFFNFVTPIDQALAAPTVQTNNLAQTDATYAENGYGINFVSNNKFASQWNDNSLSGVMNPIIGRPVF